MIISTGFQSCKKSPVIDEKKFIKIYAEMIFMQDTSSLTQSEIKDSVLKKYKVKKNEYDQTIKFYNDDPERWQKFFDSTIVYIEKLKPAPKQPDVKSLPERSVSLDKKSP
jgi:hypothetical protein